MNITSNENYITKELLEQEFANGLWHKEIAEKYGVSSRSIYTYVKKYGIKLERKNKKEEKIYICSVCGKEFKSLVNGDICGHCKAKQEFEQSHVFSESESDLGQKIINLRKQGLSYSKIAEKLNCTKSTVSYHCSQSSRDKVRERSIKNKSLCPWKYKLMDKVSNFRLRVYDNTPYHMCKDWNKKFRTAVSRFKSRGEYMETYTYHDALEHLGGTNLICYLSGTPINILTDDYQLDHILPVSKGGTNELVNMAIACPEANQMKGGLTNEELFYWCQKILEHNGYTVIKNENIETQSE